MSPTAGAAISGSANRSTHLEYSDRCDLWAGRVRGVQAQRDAGRLEIPRRIGVADQDGRSRRRELDGGSHISDSPDSVSHFNIESRSVTVLASVHLAKVANQLSSDDRSYKQAARFLVSDRHSVQSFVDDLVAQLVQAIQLSPYRFGHHWQV